MQFSNQVNVECHMSITGPEVHNDVLRLGRRWAGFVHGAGTGGTIEGIRQYTRLKSLGTRVHMVVPSESPHGIQGIGDGKDYLANRDAMDGVVKINTSDAIQRALQFAKRTGIMVGISSGANLLAAESLSGSLSGGIIVTMLCDRGERYMSVFGESL